MKTYRYNHPYTPQEKLKALTLWKSASTEYVCHRYHCSERSLWRWKAQYNGTLESLANGSHRPKTPHPNSHTSTEIKNIQNLIKRNPNIGLNELYGKLIANYGYKRNPVSLFRFLRKNKFYEDKPKRKSYKPKPYDTPKNIGEKWQVDVKYVPRECHSLCISGMDNFYQYTVIDEATRERFIYPYQELCITNTIDFVKRAVRYFGYKPKIIQTDNGIEFTYTKQTKDNREHPLDKLCRLNGIIHKTIKPRTPRHNGKAERSHRNDNERFYRYLKFHSYEDLKTQMSAYLKRSNSIPISILKTKDGKRGWLTPLQKRAELLEDKKTA